MLNEYRKIEDEQNVRREAIIEFICPGFYSKNLEKEKTKGLCFVDFADLGDTWSVSVLLERARFKKKGLPYVPDILGRSIIHNLRVSKNLTLTLSKMLQFKNCTLYQGKYFINITDDVLDRIAEVLGDNFIPTYTHRNISSDPSKTPSSELKLLRENEIKEVTKRLEKFGGIKI